LAKALPGEPVAVYAGAGKSGMFRGEDFASVEREDIKKAVRTRSIRLVVATDAACEGLNLQTLGTLRVMLCCPCSRRNTDEAVRPVFFSD